MHSDCYRPLKARLEEYENHCSWLSQRVFDMILA